MKRDEMKERPMRFNDHQGLLAHRKRPQSPLRPYERPSPTASAKVAVNELANRKRNFSSSSAF